MGQVVAFTRSKPRIAATADVTSLLARLCRASDYIQTGGWAELSPLGGISIVRYGAVLGVWVRKAEGFFYVPSGSQDNQPLIEKASADEAYRFSILIVARAGHAAGRSMGP